MRRLFALLFLAAIPSAFGAETWLKAETPDVVVYSDASKGDLQDFTLRYAEFRAGFNAFLAPEGRRAPASTILLFRKASTLRGYVTSERKRADDNLTSFTTTVDFGSLFAIALSDDVDQAVSTTFEFDATWMLPRLGYFVPLWMKQGAGEVLASIHVRKNQVIIGDAEDRFAATFDHNRNIEWSKFFGMDQSSPEYNGKDGGFTGMYQTQAWALMHTVLLDGGNPRERFQQLAAQVQGTNADEAAVARFLGTRPGSIGTAIRSHLFESRTKTYPLDVAALKAALHVTPAPEAEVRVQLGDLLEAAGNAVEAQAQYDRARYLSPDLAVVRAAVARQEWLHGDRSAAATDYRAAIEAGSRNPKAFLVSAEDRLNDASSGGMEKAGSAGESAGPAIEEIRRAIALSPGNGEAFALLARAYFVAGPVSTAHAEELTAALSDPDYGRKIRFYQALIYERLGLDAPCVADLQFLVADGNTPQGLRHNALRVLESRTFAAESKRASALVKQKQYAEARALVAAARARGDETTAADYDRLAGWIEDNVTLDHFNTLRAAQQWTDLRQAAAAYLRDHPRGQLADIARQMRQTANHALHPTASGDNPELVSASPSLIVVPALQVHLFGGNRHWADFQIYLQHVESKILAQWEAANKPAGAPHFTGKISVAFTLGASGEVVRIDRINATGGASDRLGAACAAALQNAGPFEHWPEEMTEILGEEQHLLISFAME